MVGVINPNSTQTLAIQQAFAQNATIAISPGENSPAEGPSPSSTSSITSTATASPTSAPASHSHPALTSSAIAGIAIGGAAVLLLLAAVVYLCGRQKTIGEILRRNHHVPPPSYMSEPGHISAISPQKSLVDPLRYCAHDV